VVAAKLRHQLTSRRSLTLGVFSLSVYALMELWRRKIRDNVSKQAQEEQEEVLERMQPGGGSDRASRTAKVVAARSAALASAKKRSMRGRHGNARENQAGTGRAADSHNRDQRTGQYAGPGGQNVPAARERPVSGPANNPANNPANKRRKLPAAGGSTNGNVVRNVPSFAKGRKRLSKANGWDWRRRTPSPTGRPQIQTRR